MGAVWLPRRKESRNPPHRFLHEMTEHLIPESFTLLQGLAPFFVSESLGAIVAITTFLPISDV